MPRHYHKAGSSSWPARSLTVAEAEQLALLDVFALPEMRLPNGWKLSLGGVPVAPVPPVGTPAFLRAIHLFREQLTPKARAMPEYAVASPLWHGMLSERWHELLNQYAGTVPPYQHNRHARREFWYGRSAVDMLGADGAHQGTHRAHGAHGIHPAAHQGAHGAQLGALQGAWSRHAAPGGLRIKAEPSSPPRGGRLRVPKPEPSSPGLRVPKQEPDLPPLPVEYAHLQAEDGDPKDEPGFLCALREAEAYQPQPLPPRHPDDPEDKPGFTIAMRNSVADVAIDVDNESWMYTSSDDDEEADDDE